MATDTRAKDLIDLGNREFTRREPILHLWQAQAEIFYPDRMDFTGPIPDGAERSDHLTDMVPSLLRDELGNAISSMLRPRDKEWFGQTTGDDERDRDPKNAAYLEYSTRKVKRAIYHPKAGLIGATKIADHDFVTFGQAVISLMVYQDPNNKKATPHLLFEAHHLRDCVWLENAIHEIDTLHRKFKMTAKMMVETYGEKKNRKGGKGGVLAQAVAQAYKKDPGFEFNIRSVVMPMHCYGDYTMSDGSKGDAPFIEVVIDADNCKILDERPLIDFPYIVPRWHKVSGSVYATSPCTSISLPDARMMQMMSRIILEAGEKSVDPPLVASGESIREVNLQAAGITWADNLTDGNIKNAIMPLDMDNDMQVAFAMRQDMREMLRKAWYIDKLTMPPGIGADKMTAEEVRVRTDEFIRNLLPLFEPMEIEYNTRLLDKAFLLLRDSMKVFDPADVPEDLLGADTTWSFESPIQVASRRKLSQTYQEMLGLIGATAQTKALLAQAQMPVPVKIDVGLKDGIYGIGAESDWFKTDEEEAAEAQAEAEKQQQMQQMQAINGGALTAQNVAGASQAIGQAMQPPPPQAPVGKPMPTQKALPAPSKPAAKKAA